MACIARTAAFGVNGVFRNGAPEEIRTPDPQIRSLGWAIEIIEFRYRKKAASHRNLRISAVFGCTLYRKIEHLPTRGCGAACQAVPRILICQDRLTGLPNVQIWTISGSDN